MKMLDLLRQREELTNKVIENDGEIPPELDLALCDNEKQLAEKVDSIYWVLETLEEKQEYLAKKKKEFLNQIKVAENKIDSDIGRLQYIAHLAMKDGLLRGEKTEFKLAKTPPKVIIDNESDLPAICLETKVTPNKEKIKELLKLGDVPGAHMDCGGTRIVRKEKI